MKKNYFLLVAFFMAILSFGQGSEDFTNLAAGSGYSDGSFVGNNGITWTYVQSRDAVANTGGNPTTLPALMLRRVSSNSAVSSSTISGGIGDFSVKLYKQFTGGGNRQVELFINGISKGTSTPFDDYDEHVFTVTGINVGGDITIELKDITSKQVAIDDITWTAYAGAASPALAITSPADAATVPSGDVNVTFAVSNFDVGAADGTHDGHIKYTVDAMAAPMKYDTTPIALTGLAAGAHTVAMELVDDADASLATAVTATVTFTVQAYTQVATIAALRAGTIGDAYELTGEALINYAQSYKHIKYIQDATAGIMIYDVPGNITAGVRGDGLSSIKGILSEYRGMMQLKPAMDATVVSPSTVAITPQLITLPDLVNNGEDYEAELVVLENVNLADVAGGDGNFATGTLYQMTRGAGVANFRTNFYGADYIGTAIPTVAKDIVGLITEKNGATGYGHIFTARDLADFSTASVQENNIAGLAVYPNPSNGVLNIRTESNAVKNITIYNVLGAKVFQTTTAATQVNLPNINNGIYLLNIEENDQTATIKLMIK